MASITVTRTDTFHIETCIDCGVRFGMEDEFRKARLTNRGPNNPFYCPNGHRQYFTGKSDADRERDRAEQLQRQLTAAEERAKRQRELREQAERQAAAARGQVTKIKKRVGNGICPCCNRTFSDLQRHMHTKHPEFKAEAVA